MLEKYNVNYDVPVGDKIGDNMLTDVADTYIGSIASIIDLEFVEIDGVKTFALDIKELLNPDSVIAALLDSAIFKEEGSLLENLLGINVSQILNNLNIAIASTADIYNIIPDMSLVFKGNYEQDKFVSLSVGLDVKGSEDGIVIPTLDDNNIYVVSSFGDTSLKTTFKAEFLTNGDAFANVDSIYSAIKTEAEEEQWADIGVLNFAFEAQITLGTSIATYNTYDIQFAADIDLAELYKATLTKRAYYTDADGNYVRDSYGNYLYSDLFYVRGGIFGNEQDPDLFRTLLPAINSFYLKMVNVNDPSDVLMINVLEKFTVNYAGDINGGSLYVKLAALDNICAAFGIDLRAMLGDMAGFILGMDGEIPYQSLTAIIGMLPGMLYTVPESYAALGATNMTATAPSAFTEPSYDDTTVTDPSSTFEQLLMLFFNYVKVLAEMTAIDSDSFNFYYDGYTQSGSYITFDAALHSLQDEFNQPDGIRFYTYHPIIVDNISSQVVTYIGADVQIGHGELFAAEISVNQTKPDGYYDFYVNFNLEKIGYGCAVRTPVQLDGENPVGSLYRDGAGFVVVK